MMSLVADPWVGVVLASLGLPERFMLGGVGVLLLLLIFTLRSLFTAPVSRSQLRRLSEFAEREEDLTPLQQVIQRADEEATRRTGRRARRTEDMLPTVTRWIAHSPIKWLNRLSGDLARTGSHWRASEVLYVGLLGAMLVFAVVGVWLKKVVFGAVGAALFFMVPILLVKMSAKKWNKRFESQLANTLLTMANGMEAGMGFIQAMGMVATQGQPPISEEFTKMNDDVSRRGLPIEEALQNMANRVQNDDLTLTVTALTMSLEVGGSLAEILRTIAATIRERIRLRGQIATLTAQGKLTGLILTGMPIGLFFLLNIVSPGYSTPLLGHDSVDNQDYPLGPKVLMVGVVMQATGYYFINRIVSIDV